MSDQKALSLPIPVADLLRRATRRLRWQAMAGLTPKILGAGLLLTLLLLVTSRYYPLGYPIILLGLGAGLTLLAVAGGLLYCLVRPYPTAPLTRRLDHRLNLAERLSTAVELAAAHGATPKAIVRSQFDDTVRQVGSISLTRAFPIEPSTRWLVISLVLVAANIGAVFAPNPQVQLLQQQARQQAIIAEQVAGLEEIRADLLANEALLESLQGQEALQTLDDLLQTLQDGQLSPEETLAALSDAEQGLANLQAASDKTDLTLNELAQTLNQFETTANLADALARRDLAQAGEFLQSAASGLATSPPAAQKNLAEALQQAAKTAQAAGEDELAQALADAAEALTQSANARAEGSPGDQAQQQTAQQAAQEGLEQAAQALADAQQAGNGQALQDALSRIQEARQQLAEPGQPGQGQGSGLGEGELSQQGADGAGQGTLPGQGSGAGRGEPGSNAPQDLFAERPAQELDTGNGPNQSLLGEFEQDYPSIHWGGEGGPVVNPDQQGVEGGFPIGDAPVDPNQPPNPAQVPYNQVYSDYANAASDALEDTYIPLGMKEVVRNYFGALEPE